MTLRIQIEEKYIASIKSKNTDVINTLRLIKCAIKDKDIENRAGDNKGAIEEKEILSLLQHLIKQRKDSIESFKTALRDDLIVKEQFEINLISQFLSKQLNERETEEIIVETIKKQNFSSFKDMGALMSNIKSEHTGCVDMAMAGKLEKFLLNS